MQLHCFMKFEAHYEELAGLALEPICHRAEEEVREAAAELKSSQDNDNNVEL